MNVTGSALESFNGLSPDLVVAGDLVVRDNALLGSLAGRRAPRSRARSSSRTTMRCRRSWASRASPRCRET